MRSVGFAFFRSGHGLSSAPSATCPTQALFLGAFEQPRGGRDTRWGTQQAPGALEQGGMGQGQAPVWAVGRRGPGSRVHGAESLFLSLYF